MQLIGIILILLLFFYPPAIFLLIGIWILINAISLTVRIVSYGYENQLREKEREMRKNNR